ncbi:MAG TPA: hypothetical protein VKU77_35420 [Streptosporangiaceae bacterium]|nr:hypothetical protein [Streptosporangiaceae bacterium]
MPSEPRRPARTPQAGFRPGLAAGLLRDLAPLLAQDGISTASLDLADPATLRALIRAVERHNMARFTPAGHARELAAGTVRAAAAAIAAGDGPQAAAILDQAQPESPDGSAATVAGCIGVALGLLDQWLSGCDPAAPAGLAARTRLPAGHWTGQRAAAGILSQGRNGRAYASLATLITRHGGRDVLHGSVLAVAAAAHAWTRHTGTPEDDLFLDIIR